MSGWKDDLWRDQLAEQLENQLGDATAYATRVVDWAEEADLLMPYIRDYAHQVKEMQLANDRRRYRDLTIVAVVFIASCLLARFHSLWWLALAATSGAAFTALLTWPLFSDRDDT